ncbi:basic leucine zipper 19 isoform X1 [Iris pallida]|uniref:Basic leucine zipper 19 isoform X1 n=1 Tax=Iris pallida TaxID=29817 RepID=A0AAX6FXI3_IRIPA|nr:basic leucine zipper 19 isoform X1 [Iris pallida]
MSRPPRCPPPPSGQSLIRFRSLDSILEEEQPSWLDEVLACSDGYDPGGVHLRRSASRPMVVPEVPASSRCPMVSAESDPSTVDLTELNCIGEGGGTGDGLGGSCVYGPNSPRRKSALSDSEASALMGSIPRNPLLFAAVEHPAEDATRGFHVAASDLDPENAARRRSGQRSRVRKLQYIAELERTVEVYQTLGAELAAGVATLFQQRVALSVEKETLRQQIAGLHQEKMIKDGQYRCLKNEADRLKGIYGRHRRSRSASSSLEMDAAEADRLGASWQMLDFEKLNLSESQVLLRHGFGC